MKNFFKKIKNNKASISFIRVLCYLIFIPIFAFSLDMCLLFAQTVTTNFQTAYLAEKISVQGGLIGDTKVLPGPINSLSGCTTCYTNPEISQTAYDTFVKFGLTTGDFEIFLYQEQAGNVPVFAKATNISANGSYGPNYKLRYDYMELGKLTLTTYFTPKISNFFWILKDEKIAISKTVPFVSEYIER